MFVIKIPCFMLIVLSLKSKPRHLFLGVASSFNILWSGSICLVLPQKPLWEFFQTLIFHYHFGSIIVIKSQRNFFDISPPYKQTVWSRDEIIFGITLRTISRKAYNFLRSKKVYPLPSETTLKEKYQDFQIREGKNTI